MAPEPEPASGGNPLSAFRATVEGRVQGVGFRYSACHIAQGLGLVGWVRNLPDGSVELLAEGDPEALSELRNWLSEGPPGAWVAQVRAEKLRPSGRFSEFSVEF